MTTKGPRPVLVTGATSGQGGSAAIETLKKGISVGALVRRIAMRRARWRRPVRNWSRELQIWPRGDEGRASCFLYAAGCRARVGVPRSSRRCGG